MHERVVVTGLGAVTPLGNDVPTYWAGLVAGRSGVGPISAYDATDQAVRIAAEIKDLDVAGLLGRKRARRPDRFSQVALIAADQAVADAGLDFEDSDLSRDAAVVLGTAVGGITTLLHGADVLRDTRPAAGQRSDDTHDDVQRRSGGDRHPLRSPRPDAVGGLGLCLGHPRHRRGSQTRTNRGSPRGDLRRQ